MVFTTSILYVNSIFCGLKYVKLRLLIIVLLVFFFFFQRNKILMERTIVLCHSIRTDTGIKINIIVKIHTTTSIHMEIKEVILCIHISLRTMKNVLRII